MPPSSNRRKKSGAKSTNEPLKHKDRDIAESNKTVAFFLGVPRRAQPWASQSLRPASNAASIRRRRSRAVDTQTQIDISAPDTGIRNSVAVPTSKSPTRAEAQTQAPIVLDPKPYASRNPTMTGPIHSVGFRANCSRDPTPPPEQNQQGHHAPYATGQTFTSSNAPEVTTTSSPTSSPVPRLTRTCSQPHTSRDTTSTITENSTDTCLAQHRHLAFNRNGNVGDKPEILTPIHHAAENSKNNHGLESNHPSQLINHHVRNISAGDYALPRFPSGAQNTLNRDDRGSNNSSNLSQHHDSSLNLLSPSTQSTYQPLNSTTPNPGAASNPGGPLPPRNVPSSKPNEPSQNLTATVTSPTASSHAKIQLSSPNEAIPTEPSHANLDAVEITLRSPQILAEARNNDPQPNAISDAMPSNPAATITQPQTLTAAPTYDDTGKTNADNGRTSLHRKRTYVAPESVAKRPCSHPESQQESVICTPVPTEARATAPTTIMSTVTATPSVFAPTTTAPLSVPTTSSSTASSQTTSSFFSLDWDDIERRERVCEQHNRYSSSIIVTGRLSLLRNAIVGRDVFYLVLHQIFSLTYVNMDFASNLLGIPKHEMALIIRVISSIICSSSDVDQSFHLFAISFPFPWFNMSPEDLPKEVSKTIRAIPHFLRRISTQYPKMLSHSKARGYPLLPRELSRGLLLPSSTMLRAIYCSNCRTLGVTDSDHPNLPQILVTLRAQMTARFLLCLQIENNSQFTSAELKDAEIKAIDHMKLCVKTYAEFLRNNNIPQSTVVPKPPTLVPTVTGASPALTTPSFATTDVSALATNPHPSSSYASHTPGLYSPTMGQWRGPVIASVGPTPITRGGEQMTSSLLAPSITAATYQADSSHLSLAPQFSTTSQPTLSQPTWNASLFALGSRPDLLEPLSGSQRQFQPQPQPQAQAFAQVQPLGRQAQSQTQALAHIRTQPQPQAQAFAQVQPLGRQAQSQTQALAHIQTHPQPQAQAFAQVQPLGWQAQSQTQAMAHIQTQPQPQAQAFAQVQPLGWQAQSQTQAFAQIQTQAQARTRTRTQALDQTQRQRQTMYPNEQAHTPRQQYYFNQGQQLIQGRLFQQKRQQQQQRQLQRIETQHPSLQSNPRLLINQLGSTPLSLPASPQNQAAISATNTLAAGIPSNTPSHGNQQALYNIDARSQPQLQPQQQARLGIPSLHSQAYQAQNHHTRAQQHHPTQPVPNLPARPLLSEFQLAQIGQHQRQRQYPHPLQHPNASPSIASTSNAPSSNMAVAASNSIAPPRAPDKLQRLLLPTSNVRIHPNLYPVNDYQAIQAACHNAIAMPPIMQLDYEPTMTHTTHLQYVSGFAHPPTLIEKISIIDNALFSVSSNDLRMLARHQPAPGFHQLKIRKYQAGSLTLRMRMCYFPSSHKGEISLEDWLVTKHVWPTLITIKLNGNIQTNIGRKEVFHHDLPLDITNLVVGGMNELSVGYFQKKAGFELYYAIEFVKIETPHTLHDRILNHQALPAATTMETIVSRLTATQDDDIVASEEMVISLRDPFSTRILKHPVRGMKCSHLECFDLHTWLTTRPIVRKCSLVTGQPCTYENLCGLCQRRPKGVLESPPSNPDRWSCPVYGCSEDASPKNLRLDRFLLSVCSEIPASDDVQAVIVDKQGNTKLKFATMDDATNQPQSLRKGRPLPSTGLDVAKSQDTTHTGGREESQGETTAQEPVVIDLELY